MLLPPAEIWIFVALALASASLFLHRLAPVLRILKSARPDIGFALTQIPQRLRTFVVEVLLQAKVIQQRPLPGIAHAIVFWGFAAFGLVTCHHFASALGFGFLSPDSFYARFAALFAIAVSIAIAGLFVRRFILRPQWLGEVSIESGVIAGLILTLMLTYLVAFFGNESRLVWWLHTLALLVFLPLVPHTKHLHLILSPFSIFFSHGQFAHVPPLRDDDDFGLTQGTDLTRVTALQVFSCVECGRCTEHCPAANTGKLLDPREIALGTRRYLNEFGTASTEPLLGKHLSQDAAFECTTCGACEFQCPVGVEHLPILLGLRRGAVNTGTYDDPHATKLFLALERNGNALGFASAERTKFIERERFPLFDGTQQYCLWLGCMGAYDPKGRAIIHDFARIMRHLGTSFGVLSKEKCTGDPARRLGNDLLFQQLAEANLETLRTNQVKHIVSICPHCVRTMATDWSVYGLAPTIEHHTEFLARHQAQLPQAQTGSIAYHDPCYLGRYRDVYDAPRDVLGRTGTLVEPARTRERSFCCGAGGGLTFLGEESGDRISHQRARELTATGATTIAAACPFCNSMLKDALTATAQAPPELLDIAQIIARTLPPE
jgi:Fe-S oxidoreductase